MTKRQIIPYIILGGWGFAAIALGVAWRMYFDGTLPPGLPKVCVVAAIGGAGQCLIYRMAELEDERRDESLRTAAAAFERLGVALKEAAEALNKGNDNGA